MSAKSFNFSLNACYCYLALPHLALLALKLDPESGATCPPQFLASLRLASWHVCEMLCFHLYACYCHLTLPYLALPALKLDPASGATCSLPVDIFFPLFLLLQQFSFQLHQ